MLGKRIGYGKELMAPHSLTMTMIGASLLWVGWFGFNAGSNLEANGTAALAMINTFVATAAAALRLAVRRMGRQGQAVAARHGLGRRRRPRRRHPGRGFAGPMGSIVLGLVAGVVCFFFCSTVKNALGYDDSLDVFGVHCVGGIIGAMATGILVDPTLGGVGIPDYIAKPGEARGRRLRHGDASSSPRSRRCCSRWSGRGIGSPILYKIVDVIDRPARHARRRSAKASTSPSTASAPTTTDGYLRRHEPRPPRPGLFCRRLQAMAGCPMRPPPARHVATRLEPASHLRYADWPPRPASGPSPMTYVVTENCIKCKFMDCVEVCPVDCFYEGENMLVIHPDECIDCGVCEPECPAEAIKADTEAGPREVA